MRAVGADLVLQPGGDVDYASLESVGLEQIERARRAQAVPVVFLERLDEVVGGFIHVEEAGADAGAGDAAEFADGGFEVQEYRPTEIAVEVNADRASYIRGDMLTCTVQGYLYTLDLVSNLSWGRNISWHLVSVFAPTIWSGKEPFPVARTGVTLFLGGTLAQGIGIALVSTAKNDRVEQETNASFFDGRTPEPGEWTRAAARTETPRPAIVPILGALGAFPAAHGPTVLLARTMKGKGVPGVEGTSRAHYTMLTDEEVQRTLASLEAVQ